MDTYIHVYGKVECSYCKKAISLLEEEQRDFVVTIMDHCKGFEDGIKRDLNFKTVPIVLRYSADGKMEMIGGYTELQVLIEHEKNAK